MNEAFEYYETSRRAPGVELDGVDVLAWWALGEKWAYTPGSGVRLDPDSYPFWCPMPARPVREKARDRIADICAKTGDILRRRLLCEERARMP